MSRACRMDASVFDAFSCVIKLGENRNSMPYLDGLCALRSYWCETIIMLSLGRDSGQ